MGTSKDYFWPINIKRLNGHVVVFGWMRPDPIPCVVSTHAVVERARREPIKRSIIALKDTAAAPVAEQDLRFIFHTSRCGSTLVSQILDQAPNTLSYSEHGFISKALLIDVEDGNFHFPVFRACLDLLRPSPEVQKKKIVIRFSSWTSLLLKPIIECFSSVDWCFLYRDPVEIIVSHRLSPAGWSMHPSAVTTHAPQLIDYQGKPARFAAATLDAFFEQVVTAPAARRCLIDYRDLKADVMDRLFPHFGLSLNGGAQVGIAHLMQFDAKRPTVGYFTQDIEFKQRAATQTERKAVSEGVARRYQALSGLLNLERCQNGN